MYKGTDLLECIKIFSVEDDCLKYIAEIKWPDNSYRCQKCGHENYCNGKQNYSRRCTKCKYDESPTVGTMFERIGFDLFKGIPYPLRIKRKKKGEFEL